MSSFTVNNSIATKSLARGSKPNVKKINKSTLVLQREAAAAAAKAAAEEAAKKKSEE